MNKFIEVENCSFVSMSSIIEFFIDESNFFRINYNINETHTIVNLNDHAFFYEDIEKKFEKKGKIVINEWFKKYFLFYFLSVLKADNIPVIDINTVLSIIEKFCIKVSIHHKNKYIIKKVPNYEKIEF